MTGGAKVSLVTGGAGFIGSHLVDRLLADGERVICVDDLSAGYMDNLYDAMTHPNFHFHERSVCDKDLLLELQDRYLDISTVYHLAGIVDVAYSVSHPEETMAVNFGATAALLKDAESAGCDAFIFAGSAAEYGEVYRETGLIEHDANEYTVQLSAYGQAKYRASTLVAASPIGVSLRFFNIYGPRQRFGSLYAGVIPTFIKRALNGEGITIYGDGIQTRDFLYVSDAVNAYVAAKNAKLRGIYNVGSGRSIRILELFYQLQCYFNSQLSMSFLPERPGDIQYSRANVSAFCNATGWKPAISLFDGLEKTITAAK
jgi:UDP-glucose 4-epimerase